MQSQSEVAALVTCGSCHHPVRWMMTYHRVNLCFDHDAVERRLDVHKEGWVPHRSATSGRLHMVPAAMLGSDERRSHARVMLLHRCPRRRAA